ncbi:MAG: enoyl-CoA hydratase/isomerase family protein [Hylemonella sp.]
MSATMSQAPETLLLSRHKQVAIITLNRPQALNAINLQMRGELFDVLEALRKDPEVRALVLTGGGDKAFCAGMDLREFSQILQQTPLPELRRFRWEKSDALAQFDKPVIAAVKGLAVGGGVELALQCDVCYAGESASFAFAEVSRGLIPGNGGTQRLSRRIGTNRALEMILSGRTVGAGEAVAIGLADRLVADQDLLPSAIELAERMAANAPVAVRLAKTAILRGQDLSLAEGLQLERDLASFAYTTDDAQEGPRAFVEKRPPQWRGQ